MGGERLLVWLAIQTIAWIAMGTVYLQLSSYPLRATALTSRCLLTVANGALIGSVGWLDTTLLTDRGFAYALCAINVSFAAGSVTSLMPVSRMARASAAPALLLTFLALITSNNWVPAACIATVAVVTLGEPLTNARRNVEELIDLRAAAEWAASHDPLTGLQNRAALQGSHGNWQTVLYIDLDGFKEINDSHGHQFGDDVLIDVADRLRTNLSDDGDSLVRMGGDEFVILTDIGEEAQIDSLATAIHDSLRRPFARDVALGVSIGAARLRPEDNLESGLRRADTALYLAKQQGGRRTIHDAAT